MCCDDVPWPSYPAAVAAVVAEERRRRRASGAATGSDVMGSAALLRTFHVGGEAPLVAAWTEFEASGGTRPPSRAEIGQWFVGATAATTVPGLVRVDLGDDGASWRPVSAVTVAAGQPAEVPVLVTSRATGPRRVAVGDDEALLAPGDAVLFEVLLGGEESLVPVVAGEHRHVSPPVVRRVAGGVLTLEADEPVRWSVTDAAGHAVAPAGTFLRWDTTGRGSFPARRATLAVPPGPAHVVATRGLDHRPWHADVTVAAGRTVLVRAQPRRRLDVRADGWWSADLHVHANYGGEQVVTPRDAVLAQDAEGLDLMNLTAANQLTGHVHDLPLFRALLAAPVPEPSNGLAHVGLEYRNDLYGHLHVTGARDDLGLYQRGHLDSEHPSDWPPNGDVAAAYRDAGAVVGYCHPVMPADGPVDSAADLVGRVLERSTPRSNEARCLVPDAVLGVVDSVDVLSNGDGRAAAQLYRRLLGAGLRLAVTAGSDVFLSCRHLGVHSNPPGWARMYARLPAGAPLALDAVQQAIRSGRTLATNGPWPSLTVDGEGPGGAVELAGPGVVEVEVGVVHDATCHVRLHAGSELRHAWRLQAGEATTGWSARLRLPVDRGVAITLEIDGEPGEVGLGDHAFAHTSPVWVGVTGRPARDVDDIAWCHRWIAALRSLVRAHARVDPAELAELEHRLDAADAELRRAA